MTCWPWSHKWSKWITIQEGDIVGTVNAIGLPIQEGLGERPPVTGTFEVQRRACERCGKSQRREIQS